MATERTPGRGDFGRWDARDDPDGDVVMVIRAQPSAVPMESEGTSVGTEQVALRPPLDLLKRMNLRAEMARSGITQRAEVR